jgi:hypothetical protein
MEERIVSMQKDTATGPGSGGGQAKPARSERAAPPRNPVGQTQKGIN